MNLLGLSARPSFLAYGIVTFHEEFRSNDFLLELEAIKILNAEAFLREDSIKAFTQAELGTPGGKSQCVLQDARQHIPTHFGCDEGLPSVFHRRANRQEFDL
jgi:hypothetical protein